LEYGSAVKSEGEILVTEPQVGATHTLILLLNPCFLIWVQNPGKRWSC